jgi:hypothetical protein
LKREKSDLVVSIGPRGDTVANVGFEQLDEGSA